MYIIILYHIYICIYIYTYSNYTSYYTRSSYMFKTCWSNMYYQNLKCYICIYIIMYNIYIYKIILCCILHIIYHVSLFHHTLPYGCVASFPNWGGLQNDNLNEEMMLPLDAGVSQPGNLELSARKMVLSPPRTWFWPSKLQIFPLQMFQLRDAELSSTGHDTSGIGPVRWPHKRWKKLITR
jgi:hypothetical protein